MMCFQVTSQDPLPPIRTVDAHLQGEENRELTTETIERKSYGVWLMIRQANLFCLSFFLEY